MKILIALVICALIGVTRAQVCTVDPNAVNLALFGATTQSSTFRTLPDMGPGRGVDGITATNSTIHPCVTTQLEYEPYWRLDLGESNQVDTMQLVCREDQCWNCMEGAQILVGDDPNGNNPRCATITGVSMAQPSMIFRCNGMSGRYVTLKHVKKAGIISFCELRVYNYVPLSQV